MTSTFSQRQIEDLYQKASSYIDQGYVEITHFYRNKPPSYWNSIKLEQNNIMRPTTKGTSGHRQNPINAKLKGLFFSTKLFGSVYPSSSPFGDKRFEIPAVSLFGDTVNLYFCDFYCNIRRSRRYRLRRQGPCHYIMLILCKSDSNADDFCSDRLVKLNPVDNPFLQRIEGKPPENQISYRVADEKRLWAEVFYTDELSSDLGKLKMVERPTNKQAYTGRVPNDETCQHCNFK